MRSTNHSAPIPSHIRFTVDPRLVPPTKAARRLHLTLAEFDAKLAALVRNGFPKPCSVTGHYDLVAIDIWLDQRARIGGHDDVASEQELMRQRIAEIG